MSSMFGSNQWDVRTQYDDSKKQWIYIINGDNYIVNNSKEPRLNGFAVSPQGSVFIIGNVIRSVSILGDSQINVSGTYLDNDYQRTPEFILSHLNLLSVIISDPCPWCGSQLYTQHEYVSAGTPIPGEVRMIRYFKECTECKTQGKSPEGETDYIEWWNPDEMLFDIDTKEILFNPNFIDED